MARVEVGPIRLAASGGVLLLAGLAVWSAFAPPGREDKAPAMPAIWPPATGRPLFGTATPDAHDRTRACGGAAEEIVRGPRPLSPPQGWFTSDDYPLFALVAGRTGTTRAELVVDDRGGVVGCGVAGSSGHVALDRKSCAVFRARARFVPAEDARGCPVASVWHQRVRWVIPRS